MRINKKILFKGVFNILYILFILLLLFIVSLYKRYYPLKNIPCLEIGLNDSNTVIVDIRDFNIGMHDEINGTVRIPYAYLKRYYSGIPRENLHVIATNRLELNLGVRFLLRKDFNVTSYEIEECPCGYRYKKEALDY
ncbi:sulfurtransferase [Halalkalibacter nanhaiisediminis]|uniref:Sulfurtransferase n=1 Tax=Halalkalibacter nanhaiisediminis TaxID=688079 RepID=A0A562QGK3_9BACI|nr:sulfurtransferase [Halalkalibacter nanhaiisediminis]TWI55887.1 hypothetical protein IQ10_02449 [Halalkalibacter nanhaiisediminis]